MSGWDPSGNITLNQVMVGVTVASTLWSMVQVAVSPTLENVGWLALDIGGGTALKILGKALKVIAASRAVRPAATAIRGGTQALKGLQMRMRSAVVGLHDELVDGIKQGGGAGIYQANHINQAAAFADIPYNKGLAVALEGSTAAMNSPHWKFHKVMDGFWDGYRDTQKIVTERQYRDAVRRALEYADIDSRDAVLLADAAVDQAKQFGYFGNGKIIHIPHRVTAKP